MTSFVLVNSCSDHDLTPELLTQIADALDVQLNRDVSAWWGGSFRVRAATPDNPPAPGDVVALIVDDLPDAPGAIAYHGWEGKPTVYAARSMCDGLIAGSSPLSGALSHELCECAGDEACNLWADDGAGAEWARELCDPVEARSYDIQGVLVSDFVLPAYFEPGNLGPHSYMDRLDPSMRAIFAPFGLASGGYAVKRPTVGDGTSVWGSMAHRMSGHPYIEGAMRPAKAIRSQSPVSRTFRRLHG